MPRPTAHQPLHFPSQTGMPHTNNFSNASASELLSLEHIRATLQRLEDTIVFQLIERAQFAANAPMYQPGAFPQLAEREGWHKSWTEWFLRESEKAHAKVRRWEAPDEYPFTDVQELPAPILPPVSYPTLLYPSNKGHNINVNRDIWKFYIGHVIPGICAAGSDDGQYGSAAVRDVELLSALSRRIHFGMFVSEAKFRQNPASFIYPIEVKDRKTLDALITKPEVEAALLRRLAEKADVYGRDFDTAFQVRLRREQDPEKKQAAVEEHRKIEANEVVEIYKRHVIPWTKIVEVDYLEHRLAGLSSKQIEDLRNGKPWADVEAQLQTS